MTTDSAAGSHTDPANTDPPSLEITTILTVSPGAVRHLTRFLARAERSGLLGSSPVILVHGPGLGRDLHLRVDGLPRMAVSEAATGDRDGIRDHVLWLADELQTPAFTVVALRAGLDLKKHLLAARESATALQPLGLSQSAPLLLPTRGLPRTIVTEYVGRMLEQHPVVPGSPWQQYLGMLSLSGTAPGLESTDPLPGAARLRLWLNTSATRETPTPGWRYRVGTEAADGRVVMGPPVAPSLRPDRVGVPTWDDLVVDLDLQEIPSGDYRLVIQIDTTAGPAIAQRTTIRNRPGAMLEALTHSLPPREDATSPAQAGVRYLVRPGGTERDLLLTVRQYADRWAGFLWTLRLLGVDLRFIFRGGEARSMRKLRALRLLTRPIFGHRKIWLLGERFDTAADNGAYLFEHLRRDHPRRDVYYVIDKDSPHRDRVAALGRVVEHSSFKHQLLMLHASVLADSYSLHYLIPRSWDAKLYAHALSWRIGALRVYLKHGVHLSPRAVKRFTTGYHLFVTAMPGETEALRRVTSYDQQLVETGLPRYDGLIPTPPSRTLLFMATWRRYLVPEVFGGQSADREAFEGSRYHRFMQEVLGGQRLQQLLERYDYRMVVLPHYQFTPYFDRLELGGDRVSLADLESTTFQSLLRTCDGFITDYSSVHFDVGYLGTPIIYARFDEEDYETRHAPPVWFDFAADGFGPIARSEQETLLAIEELLARDCAADPHYLARVDAAFAYRDHHNCERVIEAIDDRLNRRHDGVLPA